VISVTDPLDAIVSRVDFLLAAVAEGSLEVSHDIYARLLGSDYGRARSTPE
jgi:hypothetical protein